MLTGGNVAGGGMYPSYLTPMGGTLYFAAYDTIEGYQLWRSDGTPVQGHKDIQGGDPCAVRWAALMHVLEHPA